MRETYWKSNVVFVIYYPVIEAMSNDVYYFIPVVTYKQALVQYHMTDYIDITLQTVCNCILE